MKDAEKERREKEREREKIVQKGARNAVSCRELSRSRPHREKSVLCQFLSCCFHRKDFSTLCLGKKRIFLIGDTCARSTFVEKYIAPATRVFFEDRDRSGSISIRKQVM